MRRVQPDVVLHLASEVGGGRQLELVLPMLQANLVATVNVMVACAEVGCSRVVLAGSMEEPDASDPDAVAQSPYAAAKWGALAYARHLHTLHRLPVVHLRVFMVYGPGQPDLRKLVPYVTVSLLRGEAPRLTSGARAVDWIYVDDVVDAFLRAAVASGVEGRSLDIGSGALVTARALVVRLSELVGGALTRLRSDRGPAARTRPSGRSRCRRGGHGLAAADAAGTRACSNRGLLPVQPQPTAAALSVGTACQAGKARWKASESRIRLQRATSRGQKRRRARLQRPSCGAVKFADRASA